MQQAVQVKFKRYGSKTEASVWRVEQTSCVHSRLYIWDKL